MVTVYAPFVDKLICKYNKKPNNHEDLTQHVWMKLFDVGVLEKYHSSTRGLPKEILASQACSVLRISWSHFKNLLRSYFEETPGISQNRYAPKKVLGSLFEKDHGICAHCKRDMNKVSEMMTFWRNNPEVLDSKGRGYQEILALLGIHSRQRMFWFPEKLPNGTYQTSCFLCWRDNQRARVSTPWAPFPISGHWSSPKAKYSREDIERFAGLLGSTTSTGQTKPPTAKNPVQFKFYLATSVHNIFANYCRTADRRCKEHFPGSDLITGVSWEDSLVDSLGPRQENLLSLYQSVRLMTSGKARTTIVNVRAEEEVLMLASQGYSLNEIVEKLKLPKSVVNLLST
jgi:hypothetical protein